MKVIIEPIKHEDQPYCTTGDWRFEDSKGRPISQLQAMEWVEGEECVLRIRVSKMGDWRYEMLVAVHELCETLMCMKDGVLVEDVDAFDKAFEAAREEDNVDEPGDDPKAPYNRQHCIATAVERLMCAQLGCDWKTYDAMVLAQPTIPAKEEPPTPRIPLPQSAGPEWGFRDSPRRA